MSFHPFCVSTCEYLANNKQNSAFKPTSATNPFEPFLIQDPSGIRRAIVPIFKRDINGDIYGMGTAFHVDGWGTFLTADHVIEFAREFAKSASTLSDIAHNSNGDHPVLFLGLDLGYGTIQIPDEAFTAVETINSAMRERSNPLAHLTNRIEFENAVDLAAITAAIPASKKVPKPHFLPVRASGWDPLIGETVLAIGFPELKCQRLDQASQEMLVSEGMYGAYGRITNIYRCGTSKSNPTPVFEVECNWRSGMSGGPVFNSSGEVIGVVSRSLDPDGDLPGIGYATHLGLAPYFDSLVPTLDVLNPRCRRGWAVIKPEPWDLAGFFRDEADAKQFAQQKGSAYKAEYGVNMFGTDDFVNTPKN